MPIVAPENAFMACALPARYTPYERKRKPTKRSTRLTARSQITRQAWTQPVQHEHAHRQHFPAILCFLFCLTAVNFTRLLLSDIMFDTQYPDDVAQLRPMLLMLPIAIPSMGFGYPMATVWYFSMKVGVTLAEDEVVQVARKTTPEALKDDSTWSTTVAQPAIDLATGTLAHLSSGYGTGTGWTARFSDSKKRW